MSDRYTLITGASQGLGRAFAFECAKRGMNLILVALPGSGLEQVAHDVSAEYTVKVDILPIDLSQLDSAQKVHQWCHEKGYFDKERYEDLVSAVQIGKKKEIQRLEKAGELLYRLHSPQAGKTKQAKSGKIVPLAQKQKEPEAWDEGYMKITKLGSTTAHFENEDGDKIGPVQLNKELVDILKVGDVMNVVLGKFGKSWKVLESGNVYGEDTAF